MIDSIGNTVEVGMYATFGGLGNRDCRYGTVTGLIVEVNEDKKRVKLQVFDTEYSRGSNIPLILIKYVWKDNGKFVIVNPCGKIKQLFGQTVFSTNESLLIGEWLHHGIFKEDV